jgi:hypothetical protein
MTDLRNKICSQRDKGTDSLTGTTYYIRLMHKRAQISDPIGGHYTVTRSGI